MTDLLDRPETLGSTSSAAVLWRQDITGAAPSHRRPLPARDALSDAVQQGRRVTLVLERGQTRPAIRIETYGVHPRWWESTLEALQELLHLPENWNSYGARRVTPEAVVAVIMLIDATMSHDTLPPVVVPTVGGGVQLEWHTGSIDFEVAVTPSGRYSVFYSDSAAGEEWERDFTSPPAGVRQVLTALSST